MEESHADGRAELATGRTGPATERERGASRVYVIAGVWLVGSLVVALGPYLARFGGTLSGQHQVWDEFGGYVGGALGSLIGIANLLALIYVAVTYQSARDKEQAQQATIAVTAKLWDRQNDLDRLTIEHPELAKTFREMANHEGAYFTAPGVARDARYHQLKALCYLHLNFFEELHLTAGASSAVARQFEREQWDDFIFQYMHHALLREVFLHEKGKAYTGQFVTFMVAQREHWHEGRADPNLF